MTYCLRQHLRKRLRSEISARAITYQLLSTDCGSTINASLAVRKTSCNAHTIAAKSSSSNETPEIQTPTHRTIPPRRSYSGNIATGAQGWNSRTTVNILRSNCRRECERECSCETFPSHPLLGCSCLAWRITAGLTYTHNNR